MLSRAPGSPRRSEGCVKSSGNQEPRRSKDAAVFGGETGETGPPVLAQPGQCGQGQPGQVLRGNRGNLKTMRNLQVI